MAKNPNLGGPGPDQVAPGWSARVLDLRVAAALEALKGDPAPIDPVRLAIDLRRTQPELPAELAAEVATQVELGLRAQAKLPTWVAAGALWHRQALEQATGERAAQRTWQGHTEPHWAALDLTAGLGADTWALAQRVAHVVALEADADRAALLRHNLGRLGVAPASVHTADALEWLARYAGPPLDLAYADPARRTATVAKAVAAHDLVPNPVLLTAALVGRARRWVLKLSPLFDVAEALRLWPGASVRVLSVAGEVKAVLVSLNLTPDTSAAPTVSAEGDEVRVALAAAQWPPPPAGLRPLGAYVWLPEAALVKARLEAAWAQAHAPSAGRLAPEGFWTADQPPAATAGPAGRWLSVTEAAPYKPEALARHFRQLGLRQAHVRARGTHQSSAEVARRLGLTEGGEDYVLVGPHLAAGAAASGRSQSGLVCVRCRVWRPTDSQP